MTNTRCATCLRRVLRLRDNRIEVLPDEVCALRRLEELDVTNNALRDLPPRLALLAPTLRTLMLEGNVLRLIRRAVLDRGTPAVLAYLHDRLPPGEQG